MGQLIGGKYLDPSSKIFFGATCRYLRGEVARTICSPEKLVSLLDEMGTLSKDIVQVKMYHGDLYESRRFAGSCPSVWRNGR